MKKFFTGVPLQPKGKLGTFFYEPIGNERLRMDRKTSFPILAAVEGYAKPGEPFRLIAVTPDTEDGRYNLGKLQSELAALCADKELICERGVESVPATSDERVLSHVETFQNLIDYVEDDDELFACITYGTKPQAIALRMAVQYAYRVKRNTVISCIVYGEVDRAGGKTRIYDETALVQVDELVRMLADRGVQDPRSVIDSMLRL